MSAESLHKRIEQWRYEHERTVCPCGGERRVSQTIPRLINVEERWVWECMVRYNCCLCGCGDSLAITEPGEP